MYVMFMSGRGGAFSHLFHKIILEFLFFFIFGGVLEETEYVNVKVRAILLFHFSENIFQIRQYKD